MSSSKSSRRRGRAKPVNAYAPLNTAVHEAVRRKLENTPQYQHLAPREMREKVMDLTDRKRLRDWFDDENGSLTDTVNVRLSFSPPSRVSVREEGERGGGVGDVRTLSLRRKFEQFCEWGVHCNTSLKVNNTILKWDETGLVEPHLEPLQDNAARAGNSSSGGGGQEDMFLGRSKKLNELLDLIATYNERHSYHPTKRNSKMFIYEALEALDIEHPRAVWLLEDYTKRIKSLRSSSVPGEFTNPGALCHFIVHNLNRVVTNTHDLEYLYFMCCLSHVTSASHVTSGGKAGTNAAREQSEIEHCQQDLESAVLQVEGDLIFNQFWFQLCGLRHH